MTQVNVFQAKTELSKLISSLENGDDEEIVIARNGKPVARLICWVPTTGQKRIGAAKGMFTVPDDFDAGDAAVAELFSGEVG